jgi:quercetin dioxygenase-like cupin family protein
MRVTRTGQDLGSPGGSDTFLGEVHRNPHVQEQQIVVQEVTFRPGGRTKWHCHRMEQVLVVIRGTGTVATDEDEQEVTVGDVIFFPAGERHWHGAKDDQEGMTHLAIMPPGETDWER